MTDRIPAPAGRASFQRANDESRERLARLVAALTPDQLEADLGEGWTVASALAHMGFWDRWQAERWAEMLAGRWSAEDESVLAAEHLANEALHPYWAAIDADEIPALALEAATRLDALIARAPDATVDAIEGTPVAYLLHRHRHRGEHIDHIERVLAAAAVASSAAGVQVDRSFVDRNAASLARLSNVLGQLALGDLARPVGDGSWSVGQVLGHMAFWDRFLASRWRAALAAGPAARPAPVPHELADMLNDGLPATWARFASEAGRATMDEVLIAAEEVDRIIAGLPAESPIASILEERPALVDRSIHRTEHLDALEAAINGRRGR
jgi:uncharacterized damage-inducible protein DinB